MRGVYSPLMSPGIRARMPNPTRPVTRRLVIEDFPIPGWPCTQTPVLLISPVRSQWAGSSPTGSAVCRLRPNGTPVRVAPEATAKGNRPQSWLVVPA